MQYYVVIKILEYMYQVNYVKLPIIPCLGLQNSNFMWFDLIYVQTWKSSKHIA